MLEFILAFVAILIVLHYFKTDSNEPVFGVYQKPGLWYPVKYVIAYSVLRLRKFLHLNGNIEASGKNPGYGVKLRPSIAEVDCAQILPANQPQCADAVAFLGSSKDGVYFVAAAARRPNLVLNGFWYLRIPNVGLLEAPKLPESTLKADRDMTYGADGLLIEPVEPMKRWKISYEGKMKFCKTNEEVHVKVNFDYKSDLPYFDFDSDMPPATVARSMAREPWSRTYFQNLRSSHQTHHEQMGIMTGTVDVEHHGKFNLCLNTMRDHSYANKRDWKLMHRYALHNATVEDGTRFGVGMVSQPDIFSELEIGYLYTPNGDMYGVDTCDLPLYAHGEGGTPPLDYAFSFTAGGKTYFVHCQVIESPELFIGQEQEGRIVERMCKFRVNGKEGWGFAEWEYRHHGIKSLTH